jgi:hypothetical protein
MRHANGSGKSIKGFLFKLLSAPVTLWISRARPNRAKEWHERSLRPHANVI